MFRLLLVCVCALGMAVRTSQVLLTYTESGTQLFNHSEPATGCFADLDSYPHWCLGNLSRCHGGLTVTMWIRLHDGFPLAEEPDVILATGGYNVNTDGFFVTKRFSDQITIGVALQENLWQTTFRMTTDSWVLLSLAWGSSEGLIVLVDGILEEEIKNASIRAFNPSYDYSQARILVGVTEMGESVTSPCSTNISKVEVVNSRNTSYDENAMKNLTANLYKGCMRTNAQMNFDIENISGPNAAFSCRMLCGKKGNLFAMVLKEVSCACVNGINLTALSQVSCADRWYVYAVSRIQTKNDYQMRLDYTPQSKNPYTKPGEDFLFNVTIDYNLDNVYRFEFDDGVVVLTTKPPVSHSWASPGSHNVTVSTEIGIVILTSILQVTVEDVDEGKAPAFLGTALSHDRNALTVKILVMVVDDYLTSCFMSFGDGQESPVYEFNSSGNDYTVVHEYRVCGFYRIHTRCANKYGNTSADLGFWARETETEYHYISSQENFNVSVLGDHTFFRSLSVKVNEINVDFDRDVAAVRIRRSNLMPGADNIICLISDGVLMDRHVVSVRVRVEKPLILADKTKGAWNASVRLTFTLQPSDHIWMVIGYGNGWPKKVVYVPETDKLVPVIDMAYYKELGVYTVNVRVFNEISEANNTLEISIEVPISSLTVTTSNITSLKEDAIFVININNKRQGPQKVDFRLDYGDGYVQEIKYKNNLTNGFEPLIVKHKYMTWGIYRIKVTASNNISQMVDNDLIHVGENITFIDIRTTKERVHLGGSIDFTIDCPTGSDVRYTVDFGDGTNFTVGELTGSETSYHSNASVIGESRVIVSHMFASSGYYNVRVIAGNTFGSMTASLCPKIAVMDLVSTECQETMVSFRNTITSLTSPLVRKRSVETVVVVDAISGCPQDSGNTDLTYSWKGISLISRGKDDATEQSIYTFCAFKSTNSTLVIQALSLPFGLYRLSVTVSPESNDLVYTRKDLYIRIVQSEPIPAIDGEEVRTIMLYATAIFDISKTYDPDITENQRQGISFHLFFMPEVVLTEAKKLSLSTLTNRSSLVANKIIFPTTTVNPFFMYQYGTCFNASEGLLDDLSTFAGKITFAAANFVTDYISFGVILWAERNNLSAMTTQIIDVRESDIKLEDLGSLLSLAMNADPDTAIRLCGGAASAILNQDASSAEVQEKLAESTEAVVKTLGSVASRIDSPNQAAKCASAIKTMTSNKDIVSEGSRSSAVNAFVSLANGTSAMSEATVDDTASFAGECLGGLSNIFPSSPEEKSSTSNQKLQTTTELLGLVSTRLASSSGIPGQTTPVSTRSFTKTTPTTKRSTTTSRPTTASTTTTPTTPVVTTTTVITTPSSTIYHTVVGASLSPTVKASYADNGSNFTISGISLGTLQLNASEDNTYQYTTTTTTMATTTAATPVTVPPHPRMLEPRTDYRTAKEIGKEILGRLPQQDIYKELMDYIFNDCFLFRKVMKSPEIQNNCPAISSEAINLMKCDEDFSLQDRVFDIITQREHPDDLHEIYLTALSQAKKERDKARKETDKTVATSGQGALQTVADCVGARTADDDNTERSFTTSRLAMKLGKVAVNNATNGGEATNDSQTMQITMGSFDMPSNVLSGAAGKCPNVNTMFMGDSNNPFTYSDKGSNVGNGVLSLSYSCNGEKVKVESSQEPILLWIERNADAYEHALFVLLTNTKREVWSNFNYHPVNLTDRNSSLQVVIQPQDYLSTYDVYVKYGDRPNMTHYDYRGSTPNDDAVRILGYKSLNVTQHEQLRYTVTVPVDLTHETGTYWVGVKFKSGNMEIGASTVNTSYTLLILVSGCRYWDEDNNTWSSEGCRVGPLTTKYRTQCFCNHLTSFGADAVVAPNTIDFTNVWAKFNRLGENAAVFSTVIVLMGIYVILLIWLRHMDKKDLIKWGAMPLEDNLPTDSYHYLVAVQTGIKKGSGTDSRIRFIVSGEEGDSGVRKLIDVDNKRKHLPRGSILNYIMSVDACMGPLTFLRIWHDNSGKGKNKSWFLDNVQINDLQTGEKFIFLCDRWLAVEMDDGMVDRVLPVAGIDDLVAFKQLFTSSARKKLSNDHLWISLFSRPARSNFTRVQRLSCCMSLLFLTMITNAMWFRQDTTDTGQVEVIKLGPFSFTLAQLFISVASTLIVFPPNFLMITFFRRCRPKSNVTSQINQPEAKDKQKFRWKNVTSTSLVWAPRAKKSRFRKMKESIHKIITFHKRNLYVDKVLDNDDCDDDTHIAKPKSKQPWSLPFWCIYIAWTLCFLSIVVSGFFTILYSMEWGREKSNQWLTTFLLSFFQSVIVVQPIKVLLLVAFLACVLKKPELDDDNAKEDVNQVLVENEINERKKNIASLSQIMLQRQYDKSEFQAPDPEQLAKARHDRLMEIKVEAVLKDIAIYTFFLVVIFFLSYQQRDPQSFALSNHIKNSMLDKHDEIKTVLDYWKWLDETFLPSLYAINYANEEEIEQWRDSACAADMSNRRLGVARLRQMRVKNDTCTILSQLKTAIHHCRGDYSWTHDDTKPYLPYWVVPPANMTETLKETDDPFVYQSSLKLKNAPYVGTLATYKGGGYAIHTKRQYCRTKAIIDQAKEKNWLDLNTRAVFLEYTVYNPNSNLFASVTALTEFMTTGSATSRLDVKVFRLLSYIGGFGVIVLIFEILFGITTLFFFVQCVRKVKIERAAYFQDFWRILEFVLLCFTIACIVMYALKHVLTKVAMRALKNRKSDGFVNFNTVALYDEVYGYLMAAVVFLATVQFLRLLQFNKKMGMLGATIKVAAIDLRNFSITFMLYFLAFTCTAYLLFGNVLKSYQNFVTSAESMFAFALGSFEYEELTTAQPFWGPVFIFGYIGLVYICLMNIFVAILGEAFTQVKENVALQSNDYEVVEFIMKTIKNLFK